ncbi:MAG: hypothetical protein KGS60_19550 [Verrucomicrobia bacterium]|nr:hypothetical protein [Verrucomicrobiota bacterium]
MRPSRVLGDPAHPVNLYNCASRMLRELPPWSAVEKDHFRSLLGKMLAFSGLEMVTFCFMDDHFHLLLAVPSERESLKAMSDHALLERLACIYTPAEVKSIALALGAHRQAGREDQADALRRSYLDRMHDISAFMAEFKQRFTVWYNHRHERDGTLWRGRFKSVLVEDDPEALRTIAAYIDLNPIRAGLVEDPAFYRWSGYAEAVAGGNPARRGLSGLMQGVLTDKADVRNWAETQAIYRCWLYEASKTSESFAQGLPMKDTEEVLAQQGALSRPILAGCRIRHFTEGIAIGSREFVESVLQRYRSQFSRRRVDDARRIPVFAPTLFLSLRGLILRT